MNDAVKLAFLTNVDGVAFDENNRDHRRIRSALMSLYEKAHVDGMYDQEIKQNELGNEGSLGPQLEIASAYNRGHKDGNRRAVDRMIQHLNEEA